MADGQERAPVEAPSPRAAALADKILGKVSDRTVMDGIIAKVREGARDADGNPLPSEGDTPAPRRQKQPAAEYDETPDGDDLDDEPDEGDDAYEGDPDDDEDTDPDEGGDEGDDDADEADDADDDDTDEDGDEADDEGDEGDYDEDQTIPVMVDGKLEHPTLRELKKAYSGVGAIDKRLKEATEERKAARAERDNARKETETHRTNLMQTIQQLDQVLFMPMVDAPDRKLRQTNMQEYLMQQDAWEEDQARIASSRQKMAQFLQNQTQQRAAARKTYQEEQAVLLADRIPELKDPEKAPKVKKQIMDAAAHYGFTAEDVAGADHHGLFAMARDAARWLNLQKIKQNGGGHVPSKGETARPKRRLRAGGSVTAMKAKAGKSVKEQRTAENRARETGRVDDVTAMLISKARTSKGKSNGRRG